MSQPFRHTIRSLRADRVGSLLGMILTALVLLAVWCIWLLQERMPLYAVSKSARLEVSQTAYPIDVEQSGRITKVYINQESREMPIQQGDPLVELDDTDTRLQLSEEHAAAEAIDAQKTALLRELAALKEQEKADRRDTENKRADAQTRVKQAEISLALAQETFERTEKLYKQGMQTVSEYSKQKSTVAQRETDLESARIAYKRIDSEFQQRQADRKSRRATMEREKVSLNNTQNEKERAAERLKVKQKKYTIYAPITGTIADLQNLREGQVLAGNQTIGHILPTGTLRAVAQYVPAEAVGRIRVGQPAKIRFVGFPWSRFGTLSATVERVASEVRQERIEVVLQIDPEGINTEIPLTHGLPGDVEIEIERISPLEIALRNIGAAQTTQTIQTQTQIQTGASNNNTHPTGGQR